MSLKPHPYHTGPILDQTLYLDSSKSFTHTVLLVLSALLSHSLTEAHSNPTFPLFSLTLKETFSVRILKFLLDIDIGCFHICLILGITCITVFPINLELIEKGQCLIGSISHIKPYCVYNPHGSKNWMETQFIQVSDNAATVAFTSWYSLAFKLQKKRRYLC